MSYNSVGQAEAPKLGRGKPEGLATVGGPESGPSSVDQTIPKVARPGGGEGGNSVADGGIPRAARPGGPEGASK